MATVSYDYIHQSIVATALIAPLDSDSFYHPTSTNHTGFAADGTRYTNGVQDAGPVYASWYTEYNASPNPYRGVSATFPSKGLILLSKVSLVILDETSRSLPLWMQFLLADNFGFANNFPGALVGYTPAAVNYADGIISVALTPDPGVVTYTSNMVVSIDFVQDIIYLDVAT